MGLAALAALVAGFNVLLGVIPQTARIGHEQRQQQAAYDIAQQEAANCPGAPYEAHYYGGQYGHEAGGDKLFQGACGGDVDALAVFRLYTGHAFPEANYGIKLAMDLGYHALCVFIHAQYQHCGEYRGDCRAYHNAEEYIGVHQVKARDGGHTLCSKCYVDL